MPGTIEQSQGSTGVQSSPDKDAEKFGNEKGTTEYLSGLPGCQTALTARVLSLILGRRIGARKPGSQGTFCPRVQTESHRSSSPPPLVSRDFATLGLTALTPDP